MADTETGAAVSGAVTSTTTTAASTPSPGYILVVRHAFGDYMPGHEITDADTIREILDGELACYVIKRAA